MNNKKKTTVNSQEPDSILKECLKYYFLNNSRPLWIPLLLLLLIYLADDTLQQIAFLQRLMLLLALWGFVLH